MADQTEAIKTSVGQVVDDLIEQDDRTPVSKSAHGAEAEAALETTSDPVSELPFVEKDDLAHEWQTEKPVLCVVGRNPLDEAVALMRAQLLDKHGLRAASKVSRRSPARASFISKPRASRWYACRIWTPAAPLTCEIQSVAFGAACRRRAFCLDAGWRTSTRCAKPLIR